MFKNLPSSLAYSNQILPRIIISNTAGGNNRNRITLQTITTNTIESKQPKYHTYEWVEFSAFKWLPSCVTPQKQEIQMTKILHSRLTKHPHWSCPADISERSEWRIWTCLRSTRVHLWRMTLIDEQQKLPNLRTTSDRLSSKHSAMYYRLHDKSLCRLKTS